MIIYLNSLFFISYSDQFFILPIDNNFIGLARKLSGLCCSFLDRFVNNDGLNNRIGAIHLLERL